MESMRVCQSHIQLIVWVVLHVKMKLEIAYVKRLLINCGQASRQIESDSQASQPSFLLYLYILAITVIAPQRLRTSFKLKAFVWYKPKDSH